MAVRSESGSAMAIDSKVTDNVPVINGRKPNFFCEGFHSDEEIRSQNEFSWRIGSDLYVNPPIIAINRKTDEIVSRNMNAEDRFCLYILFLFRDFWKTEPLHNATTKTIRAMKTTTTLSVVLCFRSMDLRAVLSSFMLSL